MRTLLATLIALFTIGGDADSTDTAPASCDEPRIVLADTLTAGQIRGEISNVVYSRDGRQLICAGGSTLSIWDVATRRQVAKFVAGVKEISSLAISPQGARLACGGTDGQVALWDLSARVRMICQAPENEPLRNVTGLAFSPDGKHLATSGLGSSGYLWDVASGARLWGFAKPPTDSRSVLGYSPDGAQLAVGGDGEIVIYDVKSQQQTQTIAVPGERGLSGIGYLPDGKLISCSMQDETIDGREHPSARLMVWSSETGALLQEFDTQRLGEPRGMILTADRNNVLLSTPSELALFDISRQTYVWRVSTAENFVRGISGLAISPDGLQIARATNNIVLRFFNPETGAQLAEGSGGHEDQVLEAGFSADGQHLATIGHDRQVLVWNLKTRRQLTEFQLPPDSIPLHCAWGSEGTLYVAGKRPADPADTHFSMGGFLTALDLDKSVTLFDLAIREPVGCLTVSRDGQRVVIGTEIITLGAASPRPRHPYLEVLDARTGKRLMRLTNNAEPVLTSITFTKDDRQIVSLDFLGNLWVWDPDQTDSATQHPVPGMKVLVLSRDGSQLAGISNQGKIVRLATQTLKELQVVQQDGAEPYVTNLAATGKLVAAEWMEGGVAQALESDFTLASSIGIWDDLGQQKFRLLAEPEESGLAILTFSSSSELCCGVTRAGAIHLWQLSPKASDEPRR